MANVASDGIQTGDLDLVAYLAGVLQAVEVSGAEHVVLDLRRQVLRVLAALLDRDHRYLESGRLTKDHTLKFHSQRKMLFKNTGQLLLKNTCGQKYVKGIKA